MNLVLGGNANVGLSGGAPAAAAHGGAHAGHGGAAPRDGGIRVSEEEMAAIDRLAALGFSRN